MNKRLRAAAISIVAILMLAIVGLAIGTRGQAMDFITHPPEERSPLEETPAGFDLPYEDVTVTNASGMELAGWYVPGENRAVIMAQHGYESNRQSMLEEAELIHRRGYGILFTTIRAHDVNEGELITFGFHEMEDLDAWYEYLLTRDDVNPDKIGMLGNSLGGSLVIQYASRNENIKAIVAHSPFSSLEDTVTTSIQFFLNVPRWVAVVIKPFIVFWAEQEADLDISEINAKEWVDDISPRPVFILQAGEDVVVSPESGQLLFDAAGEPKQMWYCEDCGHTEFDKKSPQEFEDRVGAFYDQYLLGE